MMSRLCYYYDYHHYYYYYYYDYISNPLPTVFETPPKGMGSLTRKGG